MTCKMRFTGREGTLDLRLFQIAPPDLASPEVKRRFAKLVQYTEVAHGQAARPMLPRTPPPLPLPLRISSLVRRNEKTA
jgi:hypothetical protein